MKTICTFLFFTFIITQAAAQVGRLDLTFGANGAVFTNIRVSDQIEDMAIQSDGKIVVAGTTYSERGNDPEFALARYNSNGTLDNSFDGDGIVTTNILGAVNAVAIQSDGKIVVAGNPRHRGFALARYNTDGSLDNTFDGDGKLITSFGEDSFGEGSAIAIQSDGKIVVAGEINNEFALARYNTNGSLDNTFDGDGKLTTPISGVSGGQNQDRAFAIALQSNGKIVVAGVARLVDFALARYNTDGSLDNTFDGDGKLTTDFGLSEHVTALAIQNDGKIVAAGRSANNPTPDNTTNGDFALARYNTDGSLDNTFDGDGKLTTDFGSNNDAATALAIQSDGKIVAAGVGGINFDFALARYTTTGALDVTFNNSGRTRLNFGAWDVANAMKLVDNRIYVAGFTNRSGTEDFTVAAFQNDARHQQVINQTPGDVVTSGDTSLILTGSELIRLEKTNGELIAQVNPKNNNLGATSFGERIIARSDLRTTTGWFGGIAKETGGFMTRNLYINPTNQPSSSTTVRIYTTAEEIANLINSFNTQHGTSKTINDIKIIKYNGANVDLDWSNNEDNPSKYTSITPSFIGTFGESQELRFFEFEVTSYSEFWLALTTGTSLPINLISFKAELKGKNVDLKWTTANEQNIYGFNIERSSDGVNFSSIGSLIGTGNSSSLRNYSHTDYQPFKGTNFYRIKMADKDGTFTYSKVVAINMNATKGLKLFANPVKDVLHLQATGASERAELQISDAAGKIVKQQKIQLNGTTSISIDVQSLAKGNYYLILRTKERKEVQPFVKQ